MSFHFMTSGRLFRHDSRFTLRVSCTFDVHRFLIELLVVVGLLKGLAVIAVIAALTAFADLAALMTLLEFAPLSLCPVVI